MIFDSAGVNISNKPDLANISISSFPQVLLVLPAKSIWTQDTSPHLFASQHSPAHHPLSPVPPLLLAFFPAVPFTEYS